VPPGRWLLDAEEAFDPSIGALDRVYSKYGCYVDPFTLDPQGLDLGPELVAELDPVFHLTLRAGLEAFRSGVTHSLDRRRVGVVLGLLALPTEKASLLARAYLGRPFAQRAGIELPIPSVSPSAAALNGPVVGLPAAVLAKALGLHGGSYTVDAACASSLYAIKLALDELRAGRADAMLAGGVSRPDCLYTQMGFSQLRALSPSGRCSPFDARADGLVVGEGAGIFMLKRLDDALRDGDRIHAVIAGIGLSNDVGGGLLAPSSEGQLRAMTAAYREVGWKPQDVDLIECHATGTPVGDAVEFASLTTLWGKRGWRRGQCVLGSVKASVGHLLTAAGAAGLTKVLAALRDGVLPPTANFESPAGAIRLDDSPFRVLTRPQAWDPRGTGIPRRAAVSAFGFGGINAHLLLEQWPQAPASRPRPAASFSARGARPEPIAIVARDAHFGLWNSLEAVQKRVFGIDRREPAPLRDRRGTEAGAGLRRDRPDADGITGYWIEPIALDARRFRIPPRELEEMLPQQSLLLKVAGHAVEAARLTDGQRLRTGVFIGCRVDPNTTNFHFRWSLPPNLRDAAHPPLTANRVMGGLASIAASRVARAFGFGGPSFTLSSEETSGLRALEAAARALQRGEIDAALVGAVDLVGDVRTVLARFPSAPQQRVRGDGAVAFVLKRLADARRAGDTVHAIVNGIGVAAGGGIGVNLDAEARQSARHLAMVDAGLDSSAMASSQPFAATRAFGHCGATLGLASVLAAVLCLHRQVLPSGMAWIRDSADGPRRAEVCQHGNDGNCVCVALEEDAPTGLAEPPEWLVSSSRSQGQGASGESVRRVAPPAPGAQRTLAECVNQLVAAEATRGHAHAAYLQFTETVRRTVHENMAFQTTLLEELVKCKQPLGGPVADGGASVHLERAQCLDFAVGSIGRVLGPDFAEVDSFPTRVRLPDEPLMLVDRIVGVEGTPRSLASGRVITEHDIRAGAWYLDSDRIPTCIAVEAGQADLFLSAYLGIDSRTRGLAVYRLLDAVVTFHRGLPGPDATVRYDIHIDGFFRQGDTHLFRFRFEGTLDGEPLLTMTDGCAGFFTAEEIAAGKGVVAAGLSVRPRAGSQADDVADLVPRAADSFSAEQLDALRAGDLVGCFGSAFAGLQQSDPLTIPGGRMRLVDRVTDFDPSGGRYGVGSIRAEHEVAPDAWYLTCHFVDDQVMPGTLMYECCLHTLRIFLLRIGWVGAKGAVAWEPVPRVASRLKCRGQVTATTHSVSFEVSIKERDYRPEPYALADALIRADGKPIVEIVDMSVRLSGQNRERLRDMWRGLRAHSSVVRSPHSGPDTASPVNGGPRAVRFGPKTIRAFSNGKPSDAFGERYRVFDSERVIARLPGPPFQFLDRIVRIEGCEPWKMAAGGTIEAEYDVPPGAWYFEAERAPVMPFAVLVEVALQPCGWLAAYLGSALTSPVDLSFRNLGGTAVQYDSVGPDTGTLTTRVRMTSVSSSGGMIIQNYDFDVRRAGPSVYRGSTTFGFFAREALSQQLGIRDARPYEAADAERFRGRAFVFPRAAPFPDDRLRMIDHIDMLVSDGGPSGLGLIAGTKTVGPDEWFFKAHFYQDPVWPGSLGLEALLQLLKVAAAERWPATRAFVSSAGPRHGWLYRGQVVPASRQVRVIAVVTACDEARRQLTADGFLEVDGRVIYKMSDFTLRAD
jgi:3-oxoacyl-(acyl-carrier-protein) synthase/3-hydroxymyristoyl/3-hydroxydecanoyl-(acyl carrier protein) dehydratase